VAGGSAVFIISKIKVQRAKFKEFKINISNSIAKGDSSSEL
jgi:hypothetical protein